MANPEIETFRGQVPRCRHCEAPLRPNYETDKEMVVEWDGRAPGLTGRKKVYLPREEQAAYQGLDELKDGEAIADHVWGKLFWDKRKGRLYRVESYGRVLKRKFLGTFGLEGRGLFCSYRCGFLWACRHLEGGG